MKHEYVKVFRPEDHMVSDQISDASCFYFPSESLQGLMHDFMKAGKEFAALPGRIEVSDADGLLHYHQGLTIVFITSSFGEIKMVSECIPIRAGDIVVVPPRTKHLSVAAKGTTLIEHIVFIGEKGDMQAVHEE